MTKGLSQFNLRQPFLTLRVSGLNDGMIKALESFPSWSEPPEKSSFFKNAISINKLSKINHFYIFYYSDD
ncbi:MAG TPA: hypothetical protein DDW50_03910 [Firmicutes bacterium]|jgi:hypothetical protein|nr:hypothetical protein [Bacillota bacterium]